MRTGVYRIVSKKAAKEFYIIGAIDISKYYEQYDPKLFYYQLLRETNKVELAHYTLHFQNRFKPLMQTATMPEVKMGTAVIPELKVRKKRVSSKSKK